VANIFKAKTLVGRTGIFSHEVIAPNLVYNTGYQNIDGIKNFYKTPTINGDGILSSGQDIIGGDLTGDLLSATINKLQGYPLSINSPSPGQTLLWNGSTWVPGANAAGGGGGGGKVYFFNFSNHTGVAPSGGLPTDAYSALSLLGRNYDVGSSSFTSPDLTPKDQFHLVTHFVTASGDPGVRNIPAGLWDFNIWANTNTTNAIETQMKAVVNIYDPINSSYRYASESDAVFLYDALTPSQYILNVTMPQTGIQDYERIYIQLFGKKTTNPTRTITFYFDSYRPSHVHTTIPSVAGSGVVKVIDGVFQTPASTIIDIDVSPTANIQQSKIQNLTFDLADLNNKFSALSGNLINTGSILDNKINALSGYVSGISLGGLLPNSIVYTTGDQLISGNKTFLNNINVSGTGNFNNVRVSSIDKLFLSGIDMVVTGNSSINVYNAIYISGNPVLTGVIPTSQTISNLVYITGNQTISGIKTFATGVNISGHVGIGINNNDKFGLYVRKSAAGVTVNPDAGSIAVFEGSGNSHITVLASDAQTAGVVLGSPADNFGSYLSWNHDNNELKLATANPDGYIQLLTNTETQAVRITSAGNVGIGTISPSEKLQVVGNILANNLVYNTGNQFVSGIKIFGTNNFFSGNHVVMAGGSGNLASGNFSFVGGGFLNCALAVSSTVGGGGFNKAFATVSTIGGGCFNIACGAGSFVGGGSTNTACGANSFIGGGSNNCALAVSSTVGGGANNTASGSASFIGGGNFNRTFGVCSTIGGGGSNTTCGSASFIGGGTSNTACGGCSTVDGGNFNIACGGCSTVGGGNFNCTIGENSTVGGGSTNAACGGCSTVGGGANNTTCGSASFIGGGNFNRTFGVCSFIGGGGSNSACGVSSFVGGGFSNLAFGSLSFIGGGTSNTACGGCSTVGGGGFNNACGGCSTVGGGGFNCAFGIASTIGGGATNTACGNYSTVGGGSFNSACGIFSFIGGGSANFASTDYSNVGGGSNNRAIGVYSNVGGGGSNTACGSASFIGGGATNTACGNYSTVGGGSFNSACGVCSFIGGGRYNRACGTASTIGGGSTNIACGVLSTVGGGSFNCAFEIASTIGGGATNTACGVGSFVGGGSNNSARGACSFIGGGGFNCAFGIASTIGGGATNTACGNYSTVGGGCFNTACGASSFVGGGCFNIASGDNSFIGGGARNCTLASCSYIVGGNCATISINHSGAALLGDGQPRRHDSYSPHSLTLDFASGVYFSEKKVFGAVPEMVNINRNFSISNSFNSDMILANSSSTITGTIISGNVTGFNASIIQIGAGQIQITGSGIGVIISSYNNQYKTAGQFATISILHTGNNRYIMYGNTSS
jgi:hypothetical protein